MKTSKLSLLIIGSIIGIAAITASSSCRKVKVPEGIKVINPFEVERYMGTWYEIARFDFKHEKDLKNVTANYSLNGDDTVKVVNKGYNYVKNEC